MLKPRKQIAALPWRKHKGRVEVLLVTSRETKRWVIPKGWPMDHLIDSNAARQEAFEEAGVEGHVRREPLGVYEYGKRLEDGEVLPCKVTVYSMEVAGEFKKWPEKKLRKRRWFRVDEAAWEVDEPQLKDIILALG